MWFRAPFARDEVDLNRCSAPLSKMRLTSFTFRAPFSREEVDLNRYSSPLSKARLTSFLCQRLEVRLDFTLSECYKKISNLDASLKTPTLVGEKSTSLIFALDNFN